MIQAATKLRGQGNFYSKNDLYESEVSALESAKLLYFYMHLKDWGYICWKRHWGIQESQAHNNASISSICTSLPFTVTKQLCIFLRQALFCFYQDHLRNALEVICAIKKLKQNKKNHWIIGGGWEGANRMLPLPLQGHLSNAIF